jgi:hypothetical protein
LGARLFGRKTLWAQTLAPSVESISVEFIPVEFIPVEFISQVSHLRRYLSFQKVSLVSTGGSSHLKR